jgi:putative oxidoreductase
MLRESHLELVRGHGPRLGSALVGLLFVVSGAGMMSSSATTIGYFTMLGVPMAAIIFWPVVILKVLAGLALIIGKKTTEASAFLIVFTLVATLLGHLNSKVDPMFPIGLLKNLAIVGGLLFIMAYGPHGTNVRGKEAE